MDNVRQTLLRLPDGRDLDVYDSGPPDGRVLIFHHSMPAAGRPIRAMRAATDRLGLRVVSASRPGYGRSTRRLGHAVVDIADDTAAILEAIGAERCLVAGWSGGGPHALACGARLGERVDGVLTIAGFAPFTADVDWFSGMGEGNVSGFRTGLAGEAGWRPQLEGGRELFRHGSIAEIGEAWSSLLSAVDQAVLPGEVGEDILADTREGVSRSVDGWLDDGLAILKPWGFDLTEITVPSFLWHGSEDLMIPASHGRWLAEHIPGVTAHLAPGEGHISIAVGAFDRMFQELTAGR